MAAVSRSMRQERILPSLCPVHSRPLALSMAKQSAGGAGTPSRSSSPRRAPAPHPANTSSSAHTLIPDSAPAQSCRRCGSAARVRRKDPACVSRSGCGRTSSGGGRSGCMAARSGTEDALAAARADELREGAVAAAVLGHGALERHGAVAGAADGAAAAAGAGGVGGAGVVVVLLL